MSYFTRAEVSERDETAVFQSLTFEIVDLPGDLLGLTHERTIQIDINAAGYGWFIDATPWDDTEFSERRGAGELAASPNHPAHVLVDLLTTVMHELGRVLGHAHDEGGVMDDTLPLGTQRLPLDGFSEILNDLDRRDDLRQHEDVDAELIDETFASLEKLLV